jgi:hypothetical protein
VKAQFKIAWRAAGMGEKLAIGSMDGRSVWEMANYLANVENYRAAPPTLAGVTALGKASRTGGVTTRSSARAAAAAAVPARVNRLDGDTYEHDTSTGLRGLADDFDERMEHFGQTLLLTANGQEEEEPVWGAMEH